MGALARRSVLGRYSLAFLCRCGAMRGMSPPGYAARPQGKPSGPKIDPPEQSRDLSAGLAGPGARADFHKDVAFRKLSYALPGTAHVTKTPSSSTQNGKSSMKRLGSLIGKKGPRKANASYKRQSRELWSTGVVCSRNS
jgi:hypothetical protein